MRALVIDDDEVYRLLIGHTLTTMGYSVDEAYNGQIGWQLAQLSPYDLVVTDIVMPHQDGITTIRLLSNQFPAIRIVAVSGGGSLRTNLYLSMARLLGAHAILEKPFLPSALIAAVTEARSAETHDESDAADRSSARVTAGLTHR